jgi:hypothetical protein
MAATLLTAPPLWAHRDDLIPVTIQTDSIATYPPRVEWEVSTPGPQVGQQIELKYGNKKIVWGVTTTTSQSGRNWPIQINGEALSDYLERLLEMCRTNETLTDDWAIVVENGTTLVLQHRIFAPLIVETIHNLDYLTSSDFSMYQPAQPDNLRAVVDVYRADNDLLLLRQHAPYNLMTARVLLDIAPAFSLLQPHLPSTTSIVSSLVYLRYGKASVAFLEYYLRYAEKSGIPPICDALEKSAHYFALYGGHSAVAYNPTVERLCHHYLRSDGLPFLKPISESQPDWVYWIASDILSVEVSVLMYWSDGTISEHKPYAAGFTPVPNNLYWMASGFQQLHLHQIPNPIGTASEAEVIAYDFRLGEVQAIGEYFFTVKYALECCVAWDMYLLYDNGVGGMETVLLRGKKTISNEYQRENLKRTRFPKWTANAAEHDTFAATSRQVWEVSTGWYEDSYYLHHLRQLGLAKCWLVDTQYKRFLKVNVDIKSWEWHSDDQDLHAVSFKIISSWEDKNL